MDTIIAEMEFKTTTNRFFKKNKIGAIMKQSNFSKEQGYSCIVVLKFLFDLIFTGKNLYAYMENSRNKKAFGRDVIYRFLNSSKHNWRKLLLLLTAKVIVSVVELTSEKRENVIIINDDISILVMQVQRKFFIISINQNNFNSFIKRLPLNCYDVPVTVLYFLHIPIMNNAKLNCMRIKAIL